jgi:acetyl esterase
MPLHPQVSALLDSLRSAGGPPLETMTVAEARAAQRASAVALGGAVEPVSGTVDIRAAPSPAGGVPVRIHRPLGAPAGQALGGVLYLHGGGWVAGDLDTHDRVCRGLANRSGAAVIAVGYRLAPEHPFPAALEDGLAALAWTRAHAGAIGVDPGRLAVAGDSAGGNLATVIARRDRDAGGTPPLILQVLVYPITDGAMDTPSYTANAEGYHLTRAGMGWYWGHYLAGADPLHPDASPLRAADLGGLPPALVLTAEYDPLRDEGEAYADRLRAAGVPVDCRRRAGMVHGFLRWAGAVDDASATLDEIGAAIREALEPR